MKRTYKVCGIIFGIIACVLILGSVIYFHLPRELQNESSVVSNGEEMN